LLHTSNNYLPTSIKEVKELGWTDLDVILFTGDAYIDHPSFGIAVIARILENQGLRVAVVPQPNWRDDLRDFKKLGKPRLFFGVSSGNMDSMMNHYTANKRLRSNDAFTVGGKAGARPDYAVTVYSNILKQIYPETPIIVGGIEASLRRFAHYDYWGDSVLPSILEASKADLLVYGMGEKSIIEIANKLKSGQHIQQLTNIPQTAFLTKTKEKYENKKNTETIILPSFNDCKTDKSLFAEAFKLIEIESNKILAAQIIQQQGESFLIVNPPFSETTQTEIDSFYELNYTRLPHPRYSDKETIPAYEMIRHSVTIHRGCFGGCSFCTISAHQGKQIVSRSQKSIEKEIDKIALMPDFKGHITDLGGPSANMYGMAGNDKQICLKCKRNSCIHPSVCPNLNTSHNSLTELYRKIRKHPKVKKVTIGSGIRYDLFIQKLNEADKRTYLTELLKYHVSGRLKVAPEHTDGEVLALMRKPSFNLFIDLQTKFDEICKRENLNIQLIPYFISSLPGSTLKKMAKLAVQTKQLNFKLEQVQDFTPTPMTLATTIYYTSIDPFTKKKIFTAYTKDDKQKQQLFFFWQKPENKKAIQLELEKIKEHELIKQLFDFKQDKTRKFKAK